MSGQCRPELGRNRSIFNRDRPKLGGGRPNLADVAQIWTESDRPHRAPIRARSDPDPPRAANFGSVAKSATPMFVQIRALRSGPNSWATHLNDVLLSTRAHHPCARATRYRSNLSDHPRKSAVFQNTYRSAVQDGPNLVTPVRSLSNSAQIWPNPGHVESTPGPELAGIGRSWRKGGRTWSKFGGQLGGALAPSTSEPGALLLV